MRLATLLFIALLVSAGSFTGREIERRIVLKRGQTESTTKGLIPRSSDSVVYQFRADLGRRVSIRLEPDRNLIAQALLVFPSGKQDGPGTELNCTVEESGTFRIRIVPREQTWGAFRLHLSVR
jgi:hypothetical protein